MLKAIVGVEIEITRLQGKAKLSQNKEVRDIRSASEALKASGEVKISEAMSQAADVKERTQAKWMRPRKRPKNEASSLLNTRLVSVMFR